MNPKKMTGPMMLLLVAWTACAGTLPPPVSPGGMLRVVNRSGEALEVFVRGDRVLAHLETGREALVDRLLGGEAPVEARGTRTGWRFVSMVTLVSGQEARWVVLGEADQEAALKALPTGALRVQNEADEPVRIFLDGESREILWPDSDRLWSGLIPGTVTVKAQGTRTGFVMQAEIPVGPGVVPTWTIPPPQASLRVLNQSGGPVRVLVSGFPPRPLALDQETVYGNLQGDMVDVAATDDVGRPVWSGRAELKKGEVAEVRIPSPGATLSVISELSFPVSIRMDGRALGICQTQGGAEFRGLPGGRVRLSAATVDGRVVARTRLVLTEGASLLWLVRPGSADERQGEQGGLRVENPTYQDQRLQVDGVDRGRVPPGGRRLVVGLSPGRHRVQVLGDRDREVQEAEVEVPAGGDVGWVIPTSQAILALQNDRDEEVRVLLDRDPIAVLAPKERAEIAVAAGPHLLEAVGVTSFRSTEYRVLLPSGSRTSQVLGPSQATLVITNRLGDPQELFDGSRSLGILLPGERVTLRNLDAGEHQLEARSRKFPLSRHLRVHLSPGETLSWDLGNGE
ncbi:MAG TPA: hypothetical protein PLQ97_02945 [Myxococcota bacterium]|nr:hypothetical protein [Myxococcota bacterium]HQK50786.1 hypothetical protein [Myxococcota bacterium]